MGIHRVIKLEIEKNWVYQFTAISNDHRRLNLTVCANYSNITTKNRYNALQTPQYCRSCRLNHWTRLRDSAADALCEPQEHPRLPGLVPCSDRHLLLRAGILICVRTSTALSQDGIGQKACWQLEPHQNSQYSVRGSIWVPYMRVFVGRVTAVLERTRCSQEEVIRLHYSILDHWAVPLHFLGRCANLNLVVGLTPKLEGCAEYVCARVLHKQLVDNSRRNVVLAPSPRDRRIHLR